MKFERAQRIMGWTLLLASVACGGKSQRSSAEESAAGAPAQTDTNMPTRGNPLGGDAGARGSVDSLGTGGSPDDVKPADPETEPISHEFAPQCSTDTPSFWTECSFERTCAQLGCGNGISPFDENGCSRFCSNDGDCGPGQRCRFTKTVTPAEGEECPQGSEVEGCVVEGDTCSCSVSADCSYPDICVDAQRYPAADDCAIADADCETLGFLADALMLTDDVPPSRQKEAAVSSCSSAVRARQIELGCKLTPFQFGGDCNKTASITFPSTCTWDETCAAVGCGDGASIYGKDGCDRSCNTSDDCGPGERCRYTVLTRGITTSIEQCNIDGGGCSCTSNADARAPDICVDARRYPESSDCQLAELGCGELSDFANNLRELGSAPEGSAKAAAIAGCASAIQGVLQALDCAR